MTAISISSVNANESIGAGVGGTVRFEVILSEPSTEGVAVSYRTVSGSAVAEVDYPDVTGKVRFEPGETSAFVDIQVLSDTLAETDESFMLELYDPSGAAFEGGAKLLRASVFILDDDGFGLDRAMSVSSPVIVEGDGAVKAAVFTVKLSRPSDQDLVFAYETRDGSAEAREDYTAKSGILTFAAGQTDAIVRVDLTGDETVEPSETFDLVFTANSALGDRANGLAGTATLIDDDTRTGLPTLSLDAVSPLEGVGNSGFGGILRYTLTLSEPAAEAVTVDFRSIADSATSGVDFQEASGTVSFAPGETSRTINLGVRLLDDRRPEADESLVLELTNAKGAVFAGDAKVLREAVFILDDEGTGIDRALHVSSPVLVEGRRGEQNALFEIKLSRPSDERLTFDYKTKDGSAEAGEDYSGTSGQIVFEPGQTNAYVAVPVNGDRDVELSETFFLAVEPNASLGDRGVASVGEAMILDDDADRSQPTISIEAVGAQENTGFIKFSDPALTVTLSEASTEAVTVAYRTIAGTAAADVDFISVSGILTFAPGETSRTVSTRSVFDRDFESDEAFVFEVSNPEGASLANDAPWLRDTVFIEDDDGSSLDRSIFVSDTVARERDFGTSRAVFEISVSEAFEEVTTLRYSTVNGTAKAGRDYEKTSGKVTFDPGQTSAFVSVDLLGDFRAETDEVFLLVLDDASLPDTLVTPVGSTSGTATIIDNEIRGTADEDVLRGTGEPEGVYGLNGADTLLGRGGGDWLFGGRKSDVLKGGSGSDVLFGGKGRDRMLGGDGDDELIGGTGADVLVGRKGADTFVFNYGDSGTGARARDTIQDFKRGQGDAIDLSSIDGDQDSGGNQEIVFIGKDAEFSGAGQVRFDTKTSLLELNLDADDRVEMRIDLNGLGTFRVDDLIL